MSFIDAIMTLIAFPAGAGNALHAVCRSCRFIGHISVWSGDCRYRLVS
ncbi:hypothetical protein ACNKHU_01565 [Shigella flexneri]